MASKKDGLVNLFALVGGLAIVAASAFVIVTQGGAAFQGEDLTKREVAPASAATVIESTPATVVQSETSPAQRTPVPANLRRESAQRVTTGVYRCQDNGAIIYSDQPCPNGQPVDIRPNGGFFDPRARGDRSQPTDIGLIETGRSSNRSNR
jgi:hypothetical protein